MTNYGVNNLLKNDLNVDCTLLFDLKDIIDYCSINYKNEIYKNYCNIYNNKLNEFKIFNRKEFDGFRKKIILEQGKFKFYIIRYLKDTFGIKSNQSIEELNKIQSNLVSIFSVSSLQKHDDPSIFFSKLGDIHKQIYFAKYKEMEEKVIISKDQLVCNDIKNEIIIRTINSLSMLYTNDVRKLISILKSDENSFSNIDSRVLNGLDLKNLELYLINGMMKAIQNKNNKDENFKQSSQYKNLLNCIGKFVESQSNQKAIKICKKTKDIIESDISSSSILKFYDDEVNVKKVNNYNCVNIKETVNFELFDLNTKKEYIEYLRKISQFNNSFNGIKEQKVFKQKIELYFNLDCEKIYVGKNKFESYVGFPLQNGLVVFDKFYENESTKRLAYDNAAYVILEDDLKSLEKNSKAEIRELIKTGIINGKVVAHTDSWESEIINLGNMSKEDLLITSKMVR